jgi:hypothetical protein
MGFSNTHPSPAPRTPPTPNPPHDHPIDPIDHSDKECQYIPTTHKSSIFLCISLLLIFIFAVAIASVDRYILHYTIPAVSAMPVATVAILTYLMFESQLENMWPNAWAGLCRHNWGRVRMVVAILFGIEFGAVVGCGRTKG